MDPGGEVEVAVDRWERFRRAAAALGDSNRLRIARALLAGPSSVTELTTRLQLRQPLVSHHLGVLAGAGLVAVRKQGRHRFYSIVAEPDAESEGLVRQLWELGESREPEPSDEGPARAVPSNLPAAAVPSPRPEGDSPDVSDDPGDIDGHARVDDPNDRQDSADTADPGDSAEPSDPGDSADAGDTDEPGSMPHDPGESDGDLEDFLL